jgi:hypothetical protein
MKYKSLLVNICEIFRRREGKEAFVGLKISVTGQTIGLRPT